MASRSRSRQPRRERSSQEREADLAAWVPKTRLGKLVFRGEITTMSAALATGFPVREPQVVDILLPEMQDEVLDVNMVQRMTDSGRRVNFAITCVVGNSDGFVGVGRARGKEVGPAIRRAIDAAKVNLIEVRRGCGSWECGCNRPHTLPFRVVGKSGSVEVILKPAPRGVGLAVGDVAKSVLKLAGITDAWGTTAGHTKTTVNYALASFDALRRAGTVKVSGERLLKLAIKSGAEKEFVRAPHAPSVPAEGGVRPAEPGGGAPSGEADR